MELVIKDNKKKEFNKNHLANNLEKDTQLSIKKFHLFKKLSKSKHKFNLTKKIINFLSIVGFIFILGLIIFFIKQSKTNESKIINKSIFLEKGF